MKRQSRKEQPAGGNPLVEAMGIIGGISAIAGIGIFLATRESPDQALQNRTQDVVNADQVTNYMIDSPKTYVDASSNVDAVEGLSKSLNQLVYELRNKKASETQTNATITTLTQLRDDYNAKCSNPETKKLKCDKPDIFNVFNSTGITESPTVANALRIARERMIRP